MTGSLEDGCLTPSFFFLFFARLSSSVSSFRSISMSPACLYVCLSVSVCLCLSESLYVSICLSFSDSAVASVCICLPLSLSVSVCLCLSACLYVCFSRSIYLSLSAYILPFFYINILICIYNIYIYIYIYI